VINLNLCIIGGGPAGYTAALRAAQLGSQVTLIEKEEVGGTCLNVGCIPTKSLIEQSHLWYQAKHQQMFFQHMSRDAPIPWEELFSQKNQTVEWLVKGVHYLLKKAGVKVLQGTGRLIDPHLVEVTSKKSDAIGLEADVIIIAVGSRPVNPPIPGLDQEGVLNSSQLLSSDHQIQSLTIIGGGVIGIECAFIYQQLGLPVTVIEAGPDILPSVDQQIAKHLREILEQEGVRFCLSTAVTKAEEENQKKVCQLDNGERIESSHVLVAVGRQPNTEGLGLDEAGIVHHKGRIKVNKSYLTSYGHIYAVGDCSSTMMLAHVASKEATLAAEHAHGLEIEALNYQTVPQVVYTHPEVATIGLRVDQAEHLGYQAKEALFPLAGNGRALIHGEERGLVKLVYEERFGQVLGVHMIGPSASEIINQAAILMNLECTVKELSKMIIAHPTVSESLGEASYMALGRGLHI
jgi:dihydrolipoamide dehydrogenase